MYTQFKYQLVEVKFINQTKKNRLEKKCKRFKRTYRPGGVVIMGSQLLKLAMQYCCAWGMWNISSYAINPKRKKNSEIFIKNIHILLGFGVWDLPCKVLELCGWQEWRQKWPTNSQSLPQLLFPFLCLCIFHRIFAAMGSLLGSSYLSMWVQIKTGFWLYCTRKSSLLMKRQKEQTSPKKTSTRILN